MALVICMACGAGCAATLAASWAWKQMRRLAFAGLADRDTGEQRRKACPPSVDLSADYMQGCFEVEASGYKKLKNERGFFTLRNGQNIFYQTWTPVDGQVSSVVVMFHGFGDHCDFTSALKMKALCGMGRFAAAAFDMPGHGRSDGNLAEIPDWLQFVDAAREVVVEHLRPLLSTKYPNTKVFGMGESMGGGVLFSLLAREKDMFDGAILVCPMIFVSRAIFPPWIILQIFKHILVPLLPRWPITPTKNLADLCSEDPEVRKFLNGGAVHHSKVILGRAKPRLATGYELAFVAGEWMKNQIPEYDTRSLIIHGGGDVVTDQDVSKQLFQEMIHTDKQFIHPAGVWHVDLFHGGPRKTVECKLIFEAVQHWIEERS